VGLVDKHPRDGMVWYGMGGNESIDGFSACLVVIFDTKI